MREIVLDTETTGLDPKTGDRIVEIGGVELFNHIPTGRVFHRYLNPQRPMPPEAFRVHGLSDEFLADKPLFAEIADEFAAFIEGARLVIHNAAFDVGFINAEFARLQRPPIPPEMVLDTLALAKRKHPTSANSLDALCARYRIDNSGRTKHGALLDAELLADVYIELLGGRQPVLGLPGEPVATAGPAEPAPRRGPARQRPQPLPPRLTPEDEARHLAFVAKLSGDVLWRRYLDA